MPASRLIRCPPVTTRSQIHHAVICIRTGIISSVLLIVLICAVCACYIPSPEVGEIDTTHVARAKSVVVHQRRHGCVTITKSGVTDGTHSEIICRRLLEPWQRTRRYSATRSNRISDNYRCCRPEIWRCAVFQQPHCCCSCLCPCRLGCSVRRDGAHRQIVGTRTGGRGYLYVVYGSRGLQTLIIVCVIGPAEHKVICPCCGDRYIAQVYIAASALLIHHASRRISGIDWNPSVGVSRCLKTRGRTCRTVEL